MFARLLRGGLSALVLKLFAHFSCGDREGHDSALCSIHQNTV